MALIIVAIFIVCFLVAYFVRATRKIVIVVISAGVFAISLPIFFKSLRFNLLTGGEHLPSASASKEEAIKRGVYICDIQPLYTPYKGTDTLILALEEGWVERSWAGGYWYWTTLPDLGYTVRIGTRMESKKGTWVIRNNKSGYRGLEQLSFDDGQFGGSLRALPESDTLKYTVLGKDNLDFSAANIIGNVIFLLKNSPPAANGF
ncbi:hypothetical protein [Dawidia soli]|uniref:Uncharacterized protein n=1 Tax=Dawidia soli TaxID=2782352 RepID=A0AAP2DBT4_9BACT|nr:hypothetical protein [Dawidia soli]MBT1688993.1 hypothetical protein [Dawidia soli]